MYMMCMPCFIGERTISMERQKGSVNGGSSFQYIEFKCIKQTKKKAVILKKYIELEREYERGILIQCAMLSCSVMSDSMRPRGLLCPWGFSRQEYWKGQCFPSPGDLPDPGIEPGSPALQADSLPAELSGKPQINMEWQLNGCES